MIIILYNGDVMQISDYLGVIGGLSLLLYGMNMMSEGLERLTTHHLTYYLKKFTSQKYKAIMFGIIMTAIMQSSSAMTVLLIGLLNAKIIPLENALWVVLGANIGTTITGQMLAFDIGIFAPVLSFVGVIFFVFFHKPSALSILGMGLLFMGLEMMTMSFIPLQNSMFFLQFIQYLSNPLMGIVVGCLLTALIQSSSASIGILQSLASLHLLSFEKATYMIFGFDIGTCITAFIASLSGVKASKQLALFHVLINVFGMFVFTLICLLTPFIDFVYSLTPHQVSHQIANMHTIFNIGTTLLVLCVDKYFIKVIHKWI